jgi:predicted transposase YbfD/YdcC
VTTEKGHGREETRTYLQLPAPTGRPGFALWKALKTIAGVTSLCVRDGKETIEIRSYISSLAVDVKRLARAVRGHRGLENSCQWVLDVTYREDESRIREEALRENFAWLNRFTLSLLKQHPDRASIAMKGRGCGWNENCLLQMITGATIWCARALIGITGIFPRLFRLQSDGTLNLFAPRRQVLVGPHSGVLASPKFFVLVFRI